MITSFRHSEDIDQRIYKNTIRSYKHHGLMLVEKPDREEIENLMEQYNILKTYT